MPYLLETTAANSYANPASTVTVGANTDDYIEFSGYANSGNPGGSYRLFGDTGSYHYFIELTSTEVRLWISGSVKSFSSGYTQPAVGTDFVVRLVNTGGTNWECFLDGVSLGAGSGTVYVNAEFTQLLNFNSSSEAFQGGCYYIEACTDGTGTATNRWENVTDSTATTWVDTIGANDATLTNFTLPDAWIFYSSGTNTPINLSVTDLLATSARLNWEQG